MITQNPPDKGLSLKIRRGMDLADQDWGSSTGIEQGETGEQRGKARLQAMRVVKELVFYKLTCSIHMLATR